MSIDAIIDGIIAREGDYSDHPNDRGGPTRYGITEQVARANGYTGKMDQFPLHLARAIYRDQYYVAPGFVRLEGIAPKITEELVDTGVNMGPLVAGAMLQRCLNTLNREQKDYPDVKVDGWIGNGTAAAVTQFLKVRGVRGEAVLLRALNGLQCARYIEIAEKNPKQEAFLFGWIDARVS